MLIGGLNYDIRAYKGEITYGKSKKMFAIIPFIPACDFITCTCEQPDKDFGNQKGGFSW
jgi:hypothetical protein